MRQGDIDNRRIEISMKAAKVTTTAMAHRLCVGFHPPCLLRRPRSLNLHRRDDRNAKRKRERRIEAAIDQDLDRHALYDLDEITGRVLGREGCEFRTRPKLNTVHMPLKVELRIGVDRDLHRLTRTYPGKLGSLKLAVTQTSGETIEKIYWPAVT